MQMDLQTGGENRLQDTFSIYSEFWNKIGQLHLCSCHVTYEFQSESTFCSLSECQGTPFSRQARYLKVNWIRTHNHLLRKRTLNHLLEVSSAKWLSVHVQTKCLCVQIPLQSLKSVLENLIFFTKQVNLCAFYFQNCT